MKQVIILLPPKGRKDKKLPNVLQTLSKTLSSEILFSFFQGFFSLVFKTSVASLELRLNLRNSGLAVFMAM